MDGPTIYRAFVVVAYDLIDGNGVIRWHADARGDSSVMMLIGNGLVKNFRAALLQVAQQAGDAFRTPRFGPRYAARTSVLSRKYAVAPRPQARPNAGDSDSGH